MTDKLIFALIVTANFCFGEIPELQEAKIIKETVLNIHFNAFEKPVVVTLDKENVLENKWIDSVRANYYLKDANYPFEKWRSHYSANFFANEEEAQKAYDSIIKRHASGEATKNKFYKDLSKIVVMGEFWYQIKEGNYCSLIYLFHTNYKEGDEESNGKLTLSKILKYEDGKLKVASRDEARNSAKIEEFGSLPLGSFHHLKAFSQRKEGVVDSRGIIKARDED